MPTPKHLWRKEAHHFAVEIKVGEAWVRHATHHTESEAMADVDKILSDASVSAVKLEEHEITHVCTLLFEDQSAAVLKMPPQLRPTGASQPCPRCTVSAQVATDGTTDWAFCGRCDAAFPV